MIDYQYADLLTRIMYDGYEVDTRNSVTKREINLTAKFDSIPPTICSKKFLYRIKRIYKRNFKSCKFYDRLK